MKEEADAGLSESGDAECFSSLFWKRRCQHVSHPAFAVNILASLHAVSLRVVVNLRLSHAHVLRNNARRHLKDTV